MMMKKGEWVYGAKLNSLGAGSRNDNSSAKMLNIAVFFYQAQVHPRTWKIFTFIFKNFSLGLFSNF